MRSFEALDSKAPITALCPMPPPYGSISIASADSVLRFIDHRKPGWQVAPGTMAGGEGWGKGLALLFLGGEGIFMGAVTHCPLTSLRSLGSVAGIPAGQWTQRWTHPLPGCQS